MIKDPKKNFQQIYLLFSSIGFSVFLFIFLAAVSLLGTLIPQNPDVFARADQTFLVKFISFCSLYDIYHAWWFRLLLLLLAMSLIVCTLERLPGVWKIIRKKQRILSPDEIRKLKIVRSFCLEEPLEAAEKNVQNAFPKAIRSGLKEASPDFCIFYGETGRWTRLGVYWVHLSVLLLLLGGLLSSLLAFSGHVKIVEGGIAHKIETKDGKGVLDPGFSIRCDRFFVSFYDDGTPKEYLSAVTLFGENAEALLAGEIRVNHPMRFRGVRMYQSSYGIADANRIRIRLVPDEGEPVTRIIEKGEFVTEPFAGGELALTRFVDNFVLRGHLLGPSFIGVYVEPSGKRSVLLLPRHHPGFDRMNKRGFSIEIEDFDPVYYTGLQVSRDPGVGLVYAGFVLMLLGLWIALFMSHRQYLILLERKDAQTLCTFGGITNRNRIGFEAKIAGMAEKIRKPESLLRMEGNGSS